MRSRRSSTYDSDVVWRAHVHLVCRCAFASHAARQWRKLSIALMVFVCCKIKGVRRASKAFKKFLSIRALPGAAQVVLLWPIRPLHLRGQCGRAEHGEGAAASGSVWARSADLETSVVAVQGHRLATAARVGSRIFSMRACVCLMRGRAAPLARTAKSASVPRPRFRGRPRCRNGGRATKHDMLNAGLVCPWARFRARSADDVFFSRA